MYVCMYVCAHLLDWLQHNLIWPLQANSLKIFGNFDVTKRSRIRRSKRRKRDTQHEHEHYMLFTLDKTRALP